MTFLYSVFIRRPHKCLHSNLYHVAQKPGLVVGLAKFFVGYIYIFKYILQQGPEIFVHCPELF